MAEIGVWRGYFSIEMLNAANLKKLYLVDSWEPIDEEHNETALVECLQNLQGHKAGGRYEIIKKRSVNGAREFDNKSLDAVYIDASHDYQDVLDDLRAWSRVVKDGGYIFGHDYVSDNPQAKKLNFGVIEAVKAFCDEMDWYLWAVTDEEFPSFALRKSIPKIIHQLWIGDTIPERIVAWMETVRRLHPGWRIIQWDKKTIPKLGLNFDDLAFYCVNHASLSNIVRLQALKEFGGVWLDCDCESLKPLDDLLHCGAFVAPQSDGRICNAVMGAIPNHPSIIWQLARIEMLKSRDAATGVYLLTEAPRHDVSVLPSNYFYPFDFDTHESKRLPNKESYLIHHWLGSWAR